MGSDGIDNALSAIWEFLTMLFSTVYEVGGLLVETILSAIPKVIKALRGASK